MKSRTFFSLVSVTVLAASLSLIGAAAPATAADPLSFAVIGDVPYGSSQLASFPQEINEINADPNVTLASHLGDISNPLNCSSSYYSSIRSQFDRFIDPLVYTPGDNEWTDCHRASVGAGNPLTRLGTVRSTFFPAPGRTLGVNSMTVTAQPGFPENVLFDEGGLTIAALHIVGSNNDLSIWSGLGYTSRTAEQSAEVTARTNAVISLIRSAVARARANSSRAVVFITQADMFSIGAQGSTYKTAFQPIVQALASESAGFAKPVFLINGDTHSYVNDKPLTASTWLTFYGVSSVSNLTRITIKGGTEWTKFTVVPDASVLRVQRVPLGSTPPPNAAPTAAFTSSTSTLTVSVNGSGSTDSDGTIQSYAWTFGDNTTATGASATHTYSASGTYTVTLTVTDNAGATGTVSHTVTVDSGTPPPPPPPPPGGSATAQDSFSRTVSGGLGSAETGGPWTTSGTASDFAVTGTAAAVTLRAGSNRFAYLDGVSSADTEIRAVVSFPRPAVSSIYVGLVGRRLGAAAYSARVVVKPTGALQLQLRRTVEVTMKAADISGLTYASGDRLQLRLQVTGTSPTTIRGKVWKVGTAEPGTWQATITDSTAGLQAAGSIGIYGYLSGSESPPSAVVSFDDLWAGPTG